MSDLEKVDTYFSSVRHDMRSQLMVVREGTSMVLEGIGKSNCKNCFSLLRPALESADELNKMIGELFSTSRVASILTPLLSAKEEEFGAMKKQLQRKEEEIRSIKKELMEKDEEVIQKDEELSEKDDELERREEESKSLKKQILEKEEELKDTKKGLLAKEGELKTLRRELLAKEEEARPTSKPSPPENEMEVFKYELMGMISHIIRTPLAIVKESISLTLDEIPGKLNAKQKDLLTNGKQNLDTLLHSIEEIFHESWDAIIRPSEASYLGGGTGLPGKLPPKKKILIVEDQAMIVDMLKMRLEANNYEVIIANDGQEGLEKARQHHPSLIILDVMLPKMNGYQVCQLLKKDPKYSKIPIIISSGRTPEEIKKVGQEIGADAYVCKPYDAEVLLTKMNALIEGKAPA